MLISLDYDGTFTEDPELWSDFVMAAKNRGHDVICVTARNEANHKVTDFPGTVVYTNGAPKRSFAWDAGHLVDVWIDDMPDLIGGPPLLIK